MRRRLYLPKVKRLVKVLADSKLAAKVRARGRDISDRELGIITTQIRKYLATAFVQAQPIAAIYS